MKPDSSHRTLFQRALTWATHPHRTDRSTPSIPPNLSAQLITLAQADVEQVLKTLDTSQAGLSELQSRLRLKKIGLNEIAREKPPKWYAQFFKTFQNPLVILLMTLGACRT